MHIDFTCKDCQQKGHIDVPFSVIDDYNIRGDAILIEIGCNCGSRINVGELIKLKQGEENDRKKN